MAEIIYIPRGYIPRNFISVEHAEKCIEPGENITTEEKRNKIIEIKRDAKDWFSDEIKTIILISVRKHRLSYMKVIKGKIERKCVSQFKEVREVIKQNTSIDFMEKLFYVLYGWFDENESWSRDLEKRYMEENCYNYTRDRSSSHTARDKGCFEPLATAIKSDYVKSYQDIGKKNHGRYLSISTPSVEGWTRNKRILGKFYKEFVRSKYGQEHYDNLTTNNDMVSYNYFIIFVYFILFYCSLYRLLF